MAFRLWWCERHGGRAGEQMRGTEPGTLYPGVHLVMPLMEDVALFDTRDQIFTTGMRNEITAAKKPPASCSL